MSTQSLAAEIRELTLIRTALIRRHVVSPAELLPYHRRKAETLTVIACEHGGEEEREAASAAWRQVRDLQELL